MIAFIIRRLMLLPLIMWGIITITFLLMHAIPGDPIRVLLGPEVGIRPEMVEALRAEWGLDQPVAIQYMRYLGNFVRGNFGRSIRTGQAVAEDLRRRLPATLELTLASFTVILLVGVPLGVLTAMHKDRFLDHISRLGSLLFLSMPVFWVGLLVVYVLFFELRVLPSPAGRLGMLAQPPPHITGLYTLDSLLAGNPRLFLASLHQLIAPAVVGALASVGLVVRLLRASMLETLNADYVRTAWSKGLAPRRIVYRHALRNALIPTITILAIQMGVMLSGNVLVETVFTWPGVGLYFVQSIQELDYAPVIGTAALISMAFVLANLVADVLYAVVDPRIRYA